MKLASDNETLAENKALILYLLSKVNEPLENTDFYKLVLSFQNMNYFYFQQFLDNYFPIQLIFYVIANCYTKMKKEGF